MPNDRTIALTAEFAFGRLFVFVDHTGDDLGEIETSIDTFPVDAVYPEKSRTVREKINRSQQRFIESDLIIYHADNYACDPREV